MGQVSLNQIMHEMQSIGTELTTLSAQVGQTAGRFNDQQTALAVKYKSSIEESNHDRDQADKANFGMQLTTGILAACCTGGAIARPGIGSLSEIAQTASQTVVEPGINIASNVTQGVYGMKQGTNLSAQAEYSNALKTAGEIGSSGVDTIEDVMKQRESIVGSTRQALKEETEASKY
jgi:hypothetical protein